MKEWMDEKSFIQGMEDCARGLSRRCNPFNPMTVLIPGEHTRMMSWKAGYYYQVKKESTQ